MSPRVTIGLAVALALVSAYIVAVDRPLARRAQEAAHLVQIPKPAITTVTVVSAKGTVELTRRDPTHWDLTRPLHVPAATFVVGDLLDTMTSLVPQSTVRGAGKDLALYGLDTPVVRVTLLASDRRTATLEIGGPSPVATAVYARVLPGAAVYLVDSSLKDTLSKSATDLRQKTLGDFASADVQEVRIQSAKGTLAITRLGPDRWRLEGSPAWPADDFKVTDLFFPLTTSDAKAFHDDVADPATYGLAHPAVTIDLTVTGRAEPLRFLLAPGGKVTRGMAAGSRTVLDLDASVQDKLTPDRLALVSHRVLPYNVQDLTALVWRRSGKTLDVRRQGPGFSGGGMSDKEISDMFSSVNLLDADKVEAPRSLPPGPPAFEIQSEGAPDARFLVAFYLQPGGGWIAADRALGLEYRLTAHALDGLPRPLSSFLGIAAPPKAAPPAKK